MRLKGFGGLDFDGKRVGMGTTELVNERLESLLQQSEEEAVAVAAMESDEADIVKGKMVKLYVLVRRNINFCLPLMDKICLLLDLS